MGKSLSVLDSGIWKTVGTPHIMDGGSWEPVHRVWVMHGGAWKESHKTAYTEYSLEDVAGGTDIQADGNWTVPDKTRYIRVRIWGNSGSGGGGMATARYYKTGSTQYPLNPVDQTWAAGGHGGSGGYVEAVLETVPGVNFTWTGFSSTSYLTGGLGTETLSGMGYLYIAGTSTSTPLNGMKYVEPMLYEGWAPWQTHNSTDSDEKSAWHAGEGNDAPDIVFTGDSPTSGDPYVLTAGGGGKGHGGVVWTTASNKTGGYLITGVHTYTFSVSSGGDFARGTNYLGDTNNDYSEFLQSGALDFWDLTNYQNSGIYNGSATMTGNGSSFASTTLTSGGGMSGGYPGAVTLESDGAGSSVRNGKDGSVGSTGKITIETYQ